MTTKVVHIVLNNVKFDSRVLRAAETASADFPESEVFGLYKPAGDNNLPATKLKIRLFQLSCTKLPRLPLTLMLKYLELAVRQVLACGRQRQVIAHAHDLPALPLGYLLSRITGGALVYDSHELWSDPIHRGGWPGWMWKLLMWTEKTLISRCDAVITVSQGVAAAIEERYGITGIKVIRNVPPRWGDPPRSELRLRTALGLNQSDVVILHQGMASESVSLHFLIDAMKVVDRRAKLVFLGYGPAFGALRERARSQNALANRVYFLPAVRPDELPHYTSDADIGAMCFTPICESYRYALPNKLFEYIQGGLAVICPNLPELSRVIADHHVGETFEVGNVPDLAARMNRLVTDEALLAKYRRSAREARTRLSWSNEQEVLRSVYRNVLKDKRTAVG